VNGFNPITGNAAQQGILKPVTGTNPAAGAEISETVPTGKWWLLKSLSVLLVQGITQTPQPILTLDDGTNVFYEAFGASNAGAASTTARYTWAEGLQLTAHIGATTNVHANGSLPPGGILLPAGYRIKTVTVGIGANSDYGAPQLLVVEYG
jgi:hypothetical protein